MRGPAKMRIFSMVDLISIAHFKTSPADKEADEVLLGFIDACYALFVKCNQRKVFALLLKGLS